MQSCKVDKQRYGELLEQMENDVLQKKVHPKIKK